MSRIDCSYKDGSIRVVVGSEKLTVFWEQYSTPTTPNKVTKVLSIGFNALIASAPTMACAELMEALSHCDARIKAVQSVAQEDDALHTWFVKGDHGLSDRVTSTLSKARP